MKLQERLDKLREQTEAGGWQETNEIVLPLAQAADSEDWISLRIDGTDPGHCRFTAEEGEERAALIHQLLLERIMQLIDL